MEIRVSDYRVRPSRRTVGIDTNSHSALCSAWGVVMFLVLPDSPVTARFLSKDERKLAVERLRADQTGIENKTLKPYQILEAFRDYKTYFFFALATVANIPNGGISNFGIELGLDLGVV